MSLEQKGIGVQWRIESNIVSKHQIEPNNVAFDMPVLTIAYAKSFPIAQSYTNSFLIRHAKLKFIKRIRRITNRDKPIKNLKNQTFGKLCRIDRLVWLQIATQKILDY